MIIQTNTDVMFSISVRSIISVVECSIQYKIGRLVPDNKAMKANIWHETQFSTDPHPYRFVNGTFPAFLLTPAASLALCPWAGNVSEFLAIEELIME